MHCFDDFITDTDLENLNQQNYERLFKFMTFLMLHKKDAKIIGGRLRLRNVPISIFNDFINTDFTIKHKLGSWSLLRGTSYRSPKYSYSTSHFNYVDLDIDLKTHHSCVSLRKFNEFYKHSKNMNREFF